MTPDSHITLVTSEDPDGDAAAAPPAPPRPPKGLKARGRHVWRELHAIYEFDDAPEMLLIAEEACRTSDVVARLQAIVDDAEDLRVRGSQGQPVAMPEVAELRQYRALLAQLLKTLALPDEEEAGRNGVLSRSQLGRLGARGRWSGRG